VGGGIIRDTLLGALPPATFVDWRYLAVAAAGGLIAFLFSRALSRFTGAMLPDPDGWSAPRAGRTEATRCRAWRQRRVNW
jgi:uncharacterized membrane protein YeiH